MLFCGSYGARIQQHDRVSIKSVIPLVKLIVAAIKLKHRPLDVAENLNAFNDKKHPHITCLKTKIASGIETRSTGLLHFSSTQRKLFSILYHIRAKFVIKQTKTSKQLHQYLQEHSAQVPI
ncbi:hypothetical protein GQX74_012786 [Glossina fuscipes]|nr:hypothetical protein GQX74_012786 [Glossina fuscipes]